MIKRYQFKLMLFILAFLTFGFQQKEKNYKIDLSGMWQFAIDPTDKGISEKWFSSSLNFKETIILPDRWLRMGRVMMFR